MQISKLLFFFKVVSIIFNIMYIVLLPKASQGLKKDVSCKVLYTNCKKGRSYLIIWVNFRKQSNQGKKRVSWGGMNGKTRQQ